MKFIKKNLFVIIALVSLLVIFVTSGTRDCGGWGKTAYQRTVQAFDGLKDNDLEKKMLISYSESLDDDQKFLFNTAFGEKLLSYMDFKVERATSESKEKLKTICKVTVTITSVDLKNIPGMYELIADSMNKSESGILNDLLVKAVENCKDDKVKSNVEVNAYLNPEHSTWTIVIDSNVFDALFPNYDDYANWRYGE